jgi:hypothetical protein
VGRGRRGGPEIVSGGGSGVQVSPMGGGVTLGGIAEQAKRLNKELRETKVLGADAGDLLERAGVRGVKSMKDLDGVVRSLAVELLRLAANPLLKSASSAHRQLLQRRRLERRVELVGRLRRRLR